MLVRSARPPIVEDVPALEVAGITVRFGGIVAVDDASLRVGNDEIVGLIGTNGAGKSTLMNAIGGFVPCAGHGASCTATTCRRSVRRTRARMGLGRTFQAALLFPELTVRETVEVALEARGRTGLLSTALFLPRSLRLASGSGAPRPTTSSASSASVATPATASPTSPPAPAASSSSPACSPSTHACSASTNRPPASRNARPRRSVR